MIKLEKFLPLTQAQLFNSLCKSYRGKCIFSNGNFILVRGKAPIMLLAHLDTVHEKPVREICATKNLEMLAGKSPLDALSASISVFTAC